MLFRILLLGYFLSITACQVKNNAITDLPFDFDGKIIFLKAISANSDTLCFILDSGFPNSVLNKSTADSLKLKYDNEQNEKVAGGSANIALLDSIKIKLGKIDFVAKDVQVVSLDGVAAVIGRKVDGIIGHDFFLTHVFSIDFEQNKIQILDTISYKYHGSGTIVPITIEDGQPFLEMTIFVDGKPTKAKIKLDTGSADALGLNGSFVHSEHLFSQEHSKLPVMGQALGGKTKNYITRADKLQIRDIVLKDPYLGFSEDTLRKGDAGTMGNELLRRFNIIFNYKAKQVILEKNKYIDEPFNYDCSGLFIIQQSGHKMIIDVIKTSPADKSGFLYGDEIIDVNGKKATGLSLSEIRKMFMIPVKSFQVKVDRSGKQIILELNTAKYI
jgi:hypothetical protein